MNSSVAGDHNSMAGENIFHNQKLGVEILSWSKPYGFYYSTFNSKSPENYVPKVRLGSSSSSVNLRGSGEVKKKGEKPKFHFPQDVIHKSLEIQSKKDGFGIGSEEISIAKSPDAQSFVAGQPVPRRKSVIKFAQNQIVGNKSSEIGQTDQALKQNEKENTKPIEINGWQNKKMTIDLGLCKPRELSRQQSAKNIPVTNLLIPTPKGMFLSDIKTLDLNEQKLT